MARGTTFLKDNRYPELFGPAVVHDLTDEQVWSSEQVRQKLEEEMHAALRRTVGQETRTRIVRGCSLVLVGPDTRGLPRRKARRLSDALYKENLRRVVVYTGKILGDRRRARQLRWASSQRHWLVSTPPHALKAAFMWLNRLLGGQ